MNTPTERVSTHCAMPMLMGHLTRKLSMTETYYLSGDMRTHKSRVMKMLHYSRGIHFKKNYHHYSPLFPSIWLFFKGI